MSLILMISIQDQLVGTVLGVHATLEAKNEANKKHIYSASRGSGFD